MMVMIIIVMVIVVKMMIVMAYDKSRDDDINYGHDYDINSHDDHDDDDDHDNSDTWGMNDMIFSSMNIYYNQHHDISHLLELHDEVLMVVMMATMIKIITMMHMIMTMAIII